MDRAHLSRHCFPIRPGKWCAIVDHRDGPCFSTTAVRISSSAGVHAILMAAAAPAGPRKRATVSAASSAVTKSPRFLVRPPRVSCALNGLLMLLLWLTPLKPATCSARSSVSPSAAAAACASDAVMGGR